MTQQSTDVDHFDHDDAWQIGSTLLARCRADDLPVVIIIWLGEQRVFQVALPGTSADNDSWAERKARVVRRFARPSIEVYEQFAKNNPDFYRVFGISPERYAAAGGAVPIRLHGAIVGVLAVSGLESGADHDLAATALQAHVGRS